MEALKVAVQPLADKDKQKKDSILRAMLSFLYRRFIFYEWFYNRSFQRLNCSVTRFCLLKFFEF